MRKRRGLSPLTLTPLIDIVFQLIAFFVFATGFQQVNREVSPPIASLEGFVEDSGILMVELDETGNIWIQQKHVKDGVNGLRDMLGAALKSGSKMLVVRADGKADYDRIHQTIEVAYEHDVQEIQLQVRGQD